MWYVVDNVNWICLSARGQGKEKKKGKRLKILSPFKEARKSSSEIEDFCNSLPISFSQTWTTSLWDKIFLGGLRYTVLFRVRGSSMVLIVYLAMSSSSTYIATKYSKKQHTYKKFQLEHKTLILRILSDNIQLFLKNKYKRLLHQLLYQDDRNNIIYLRTRFRLHVLFSDFFFFFFFGSFVSNCSDIHSN